MKFEGSRSLTFLILLYIYIYTYVVIKNIWQVASILVYPTFMKYKQGMKQQYISSNIYEILVVKW